MPISSITYDTVVTQVKNWIKGNCSNIANYSGMNSAFKSGYSTSGTVLTSPQYTGTYTVSISTYISQVASSTVDTDMSSFCSTYGITSRLSSNIPASEFLHFIQNMISFICTKCAFTCSQYVQGTRYLVYYTGNTTYNTIYTISDTDTKKLLIATDATNVVDTVVSIASQNMRCVPIKYSWSFSS